MCSRQRVTPSFISRHVDGNTERQQIIHADYLDPQQDSSRLSLATLLEDLPRNHRKDASSTAAVRSKPCPCDIARVLLQSGIHTRKCRTDSLAGRCAAIREGGQELHKLLKDTNRKLKVSAGLPDWKNYVDFVNSLVVQGLIRVVAVSLSTLNQQMSQAYIAKQQLPPMLELEMHLADGKVTYIPDIGGVESRVNPEQAAVNAGHSQKGTGAGGGSSRAAGAGGGGKWAASWGARATLRRMTWGWVEGFLNVAKAFRRIDATEGTYLKDIQDDPEVRSQVSQIHERLDVMETAMLAYKKQFSAYEYLWTTDLQAMFRVFLEEASYDEAMEEDDEDPTAATGGGGGSSRAGGAEQGGGGAGGGGDGDGPDETRVVRMLDLAKFDEKIHLYLGVQSEVTSLRHTQDVGFVRVNAQPMKQAISTWVTKWIYVFAQSLQDHVSTSLERMYSFISYTQKGLETPLSVSAPPLSVGVPPLSVSMPPSALARLEG